MNLEPGEGSDIQPPRSHTIPDAQRRDALYHKRPRKGAAFTYPGVADLPRRSPQGEEGGQSRIPVRMSVILAGGSGGTNALRRAMFYSTAKSISSTGSPSEPCTWHVKPPLVWKMQISLSVKETAVSQKIEAYRLLYASQYQSTP